MYTYRLTSTKNLNITRDIFRSYPDTTYLVKLTKLNRPCIQVYDVDKKLIGILILKKNKRSIKICLLLVHSRYRTSGLGNSLIRLTINALYSDFNDADVLYTVCPHQFKTDAYQDLLIHNNFILSTIRANGDLVYSYAKSI